MLHSPTGFLKSLVCCGALVTSASIPALASDVSGDWKVKEGVAIIRIANCDGRVWGAVVWEKSPGGRDTENPDRQKVNRPTLGMPILLDMKPNANGDWEGYVYNAKNGKTYESRLHLASANALEIEGCVLGFLCGGETWTRVVDANRPPGAPVALANPTATDATKNVVTKAPPAAKTPSATAKAPPPAGAAPKVATKGAGAAKTTGSAPAPATPEDPVGDICLLPDIARGPH